MSPKDGVELGLEAVELSEELLRGEFGDLLLLKGLRGHFAWTSSYFLTFTSWTSTKSPSEIPSVKQIS